MGYMSISHWIIVAIVALVLFGRGRISETMADFGKGISSFRRGLTENADDRPPSATGPAKLAEPDQSPDA